MANGNTTQVIKPIYHVGVVVLITIFFIALNLAGLVNADTEVPSSIDTAVGFVLSVRTLYIFPFVLLLLAALHGKFKADYMWRSKLRKAFFFVLVMFTGKFYTWAGFFFAWWLASKHVSYVTPIPFAIAYGAICLLLGWVSWVLARSFAVALWKKS